MLILGLLMINGENDILETVLDKHGEIVDWFYVLDGTVPNTISERICKAHPKCAGYLTDAELPRERFTDKPVCGYRQAIYEMAVADHGCENWFVLLHGDEIWTQHPEEVINGHDGYVFLLPFYFPRAGERWDYDAHPLAQLRWHLKPGFPEFRMFRGGPHVRYDEHQTFNTKPQGIHGNALAASPIKHYLYRSPDAQRARAQQHLETGFDPDNYLHVIERDAVYWTDEMIADYQQRPYFTELACDV